MRRPRAFGPRTLRINAVFLVRIDLHPTPGQHFMSTSGYTMPRMQGEITFWVGELDVVMNLAFFLLTERCFRFAWDLEENKVVDEFILNLRVNDLRKQKLLFLEDQDDVADRTPDYCFRDQCNIYCVILLWKAQDSPWQAFLMNSPHLQTPHLKGKRYGKGFVHLLCWTYSAHSGCPGDVSGARQHWHSGESTTSLALSLSILILRAESGFDWTYLVQSDLLSEIPYQTGFKEVKSSTQLIPQLPRWRVNKLKGQGTGQVAQSYQIWELWPPARVYKTNQRTSFNFSAVH